MRGETVVVEDLVPDGKDRYGKPQYATLDIEVENVLVAPGATDDVIDSNRDGVTVAYTLYFPKTYTGDLEGRKVRVRGEPFDVIGSPRPYPVETTPTDWNRKAEVEKTDG